VVHLSDYCQLLAPVKADHENLGPGLCPLGFGMRSPYKPSPETDMLSYQIWWLCCNVTLGQIVDRKICPFGGNLFPCNHILLGPLV